MRKILSFTLTFMLAFSTIAIASNSRYCDSSAGRNVLNNGDYSKKYCTKTAVMDLQNISSCCTWHGGVLSADEGLVVCNDSYISPICSTQAAQDYQKDKFNYAKESQSYFEFNQ